MFNTFFQYLFGFSVLGTKTVYKASAKTIGIIIDKITIILPFLSQRELLSWSKEIINAKPSIYSKAMDSKYIENNFNLGHSHRNFDGGHGLFSSLQKVRDADPNDTTSQEVFAWLNEYFIKDSTTPMGMPLTFDKFDKTKTDKFQDWVTNNIPGSSNTWFNDLITFDAFEILSTSLGICGAIYYLKKEDVQKLSEILGSMGIISIITGNPIMGMAVILYTTHAYLFKKNKLDKNAAMKGIGYTGISLTIFGVLGLPILLELFIVINILRLIKGQNIIGSEFIKNIFKRLAKLSPDDSNRCDDLPYQYRKGYNWTF